MRISRPPSSFTASSAVELKSPRIDALCTRIDTFPEPPISFASSLSCLSVPGSCDASISLAPACANAAAAAAPTECSAPMTTAAFPSSENSLSAIGFEVVLKSVAHLRSDAERRHAAGQSSAIDCDQFAVDMIRRLRREEDREGADFDIFATAAHRNELAALEKSHHLFVMRKNPRHDAIGLDVVLRVSQRHRTGELDHAALRACV